MEAAEDELRRAQNDRRRETRVAAEERRLEDLYSTARSRQQDEEDAEDEAEIREMAGVTRVQLSRGEVELIEEMGMFADAEGGMLMSLPRCARRQ